MRYSLVTVVLFTIALGAPAGEKPHPHAKTLAPLIDEQTLAIAHLDLKRLDLKRLDPGEVYRELVEKFKLDTQAPEKFKELLVQRMDLVRKAGLQHLYLLVNLSDIPATMPLVVMIGPEGKDQEFLKRIWRDLDLPGEPIPLPAPNAVAGPAEQAKRLLGGQAAERPEFLRALDRKPAVVAQMVVSLPASLRRAFRETVPHLPAALGGARIGPLVDGFQLAHLRFERKPQVQVRLSVEMEDADAAQQLEQLLQKTVAHWREQQDIKKHLPLWEPFLKAVTLQRTDSRLEASLSEEQLEQMVKQLSVVLQANADYRQDLNNLKQIGLAIHNYYDAYRSLPPAVFRGKDGKALLSWRVYLLPYLDQEKLYRQFKLHEPWDSPHNKALIEKMPAVYRAPGSKADPGKTTYLAPINDTTMWGDPKVKSISGITDGTSNTIMLVRVDDASAVIWTKPEDLPVDPKQPLRGLRLDEDRRFVTLFADGSVRTLPGTITPATLNALFSARGGEVIPEP